MKLDNFGLPIENNADDKQDSARLAGILKTFEYPINFDIKKYVTKGNTYCRHPEEYKYTFSRDQMTALFAGLHIEGYWWLIDPKYKPENGDIISPSVRGHILRCNNQQANWFQNLWLWLDVLWATFIAQMQESNQLLSMLMIADPKYLKFYTKYNKFWETNIKSYWCGWRNEKDLAEHIINKVKLRVK